MAQMKVKNSELSASYESTSRQVAALSAKVAQLEVCDSESRVVTLTGSSLLCQEHITTAIRAQCDTIRRAFERATDKERANRFFFRLSKDVLPI